MVLLILSPVIFQHEKQEGTGVEIQSEQIGEPVKNRCFSDPFQLKVFLLFWSTKRIRAGTVQGESLAAGDIIDL